MELFGNGMFTLADKFRLFSDLNDDSLSSVPEKTKEEIRLWADRALEYKPEVITAGLYKRFYIDGDRLEFGAVYQKKRDAVFNLTLGCACFGCDKYKDKLLDVVWNILEETSWVIPAHNVARDARLLSKCLPDAFGEKVYYIDLFSAVTGALLSLVLYYAGDALDGISDGIASERIKYELERRIIKPYLLYDMRWTYVSINNWLPWIVSNVLLTASITEGDAQVRRSVISKAQEHLNMFVSTYGDDGGCNEGASYWGASIATLFDACEIIYDMTGGNVDVFKSPFLQRACGFICDMCLYESKNLYVNFADCGRILLSDPDMLYRMARRTGSQKLADFADRIAIPVSKAGKEVKPANSFPYRTLKSFLSYHAVPEGISPDSGDKSCVYPDLQVAVLKRGKFAAAVKGGNNGESHNHNDVGNFIVYYDGSPVIIDMGNDTYRRETFNRMRYTLRENQSSYHNLPDFGGTAEHEGKEYRADGFSCDEAGGTVNVSYAGAYPECAGVSECGRTVTASENGVNVHDTFRASGEAVFNLMLCDEPSVNGDTVIAGKCKMSFSPDAEITCETVDIKGCPKLSADWNGDRLYRLRVRPRGDALSVSITPLKENV